MTDAARLPALLADLDDEGADLDALLAAARAEHGPTGWAGIPTPAPGWSIAHQIAHLAWADDQAYVAATDPEAAAATFAAVRATPGPITVVDDAAAAGAAVAARDPDELLTDWRAGRARLRAALAAVPEGARLPWFGPPMTAASMATARLMETWAHGQDVADALGVRRTPTARLRHVAHIGVRARDFAYRTHGRTPPDGEFRVELIGPDGDLWTWGPDDTSDRVSGSALGFCLLVTRRRHRADVDLVATGPAAGEWLDIAQAFAGPPGAGRTPAAEQPATEQPAAEQPGAALP